MAKPPIIIDDLYLEEIKSYCCCENLSPIWLPGLFSFVIAYKLSRVILRSSIANGCTEF